MGELEIMIHLPKTGGTSLIRILHEQIYFSRFIGINPSRDTHPKDFLKTYPDRLQSISSGLLNYKKIITGHFAFGVHNYFDRPFRYITILRNPVDRVISEYFYMQQNFYHHELIKKQHLSLQDYLYHPQTFYLNNLQTRLLSGVSYDAGDNVTEEMYELAEKNLKQMASVGITEYFAESLALFYLKLEWPRVPYMVRVNTNPEKPGNEIFNEEVIDAISKREQFDLRLYASANEIFNIEVEKEFETINRVIEIIQNPSLYRKLYLRSLYYFDKVINKINQAF